MLTMTLIIKIAY